VPGLLDVLDWFNVVDRVRGALFAGLAVAGGKGWVHTFRIPRGQGHTGLELDRLLHRYGVDLNGRRITSQYIIFGVRQSQAAWAERILVGENAIPEGPLVDENNRSKFGQPVGEAWESKRKRHHPIISVPHGWF
jgi:hypothetical protein